MAHMVKNPPASAEDVGSTSVLGRVPGEENGYPLQYSCLEISHGQRSLVGYSPWGHTESNMTEQLTHTHTYKKVLSVCLAVPWENNEET